MQCPEITIEHFSTHGIHLDPKSTVYQSIVQKDSLSSSYQLLFFPEDWEGGPVIDGIRYPAAADHFVCCKPLQHKRMEGPFKSYIISLTTADPQLQEALDNLPTYAYHADTAQILQQIKTMCQVATRTALIDRLELAVHVSTVLRTLLSAEYPLEHTHHANPRRHQEALLAANQYLKDHLEEDVDLQQLAKDSHLHPTYFHKLFTATFGKTPAQQLMHYRILASREYLRRDDCTISEIARRCGFSSQSYYCRKYKEISMETPSQYRRIIRKRRKKGL